MEHVEVHIVFHAKDGLKVGDSLWKYMENLEPIHSLDQSLMQIGPKAHSCTMLVTIKEQNRAYDPVLFTNLFIDAAMSRTTATDYSLFSRKYSTVS